MSAIHDVDVDLATFLRPESAIYNGRHGLCPPFRTFMPPPKGWMAREIPLSHCVDVIERFLRRHGRQLLFLVLETGILLGSTV